MKGMDWIWMAVLMTITGFALLRLVGRKSISQMTIPTTVIMISIGSIIIQPFIEKSIWKTIGSAFIIVVLLITVEKLQVRFQWMEKFLEGQSLPVIENGKLNANNLRKMRMTVDQLEMRLRQSGYGSLEEIEAATLEPNGQIGILPKPDFKPVTVRELRNVLEQYLSSAPKLSGGAPTDKEEHPPLFEESVEGGHKEGIDRELQ